MTWASIVMSCVLMNVCEAAAASQRQGQLYLHPAVRRQAAACSVELCGMRGRSWSLPLGVRPHPHRCIMRQSTSNWLFTVCKVRFLKSRDPQPCDEQIGTAHCTNKAARPMPAGQRLLSLDHIADLLHTGKAASKHVQQCIFPC